METNPFFILPELDLTAWEQTKNTLNLYLQVVGKIQLALMPRKNHWWNITFLVNAKGLITHTIPAEGFTFEIQFNFFSHKLELITSDGAYRSFDFADGLSVSAFYRNVFHILSTLGITPVIIGHPFSVPGEPSIDTPFGDINWLASYDRDYVRRFWRILIWTSGVFNEFSGRFYGKTSPVQLFWHHMDLAVTRFCGRRAPELPADANISTKDAYSHEVISFGFWAGDDKVRGAAYYSYTYPAPKGLGQEKLAPGAAFWADSNGSPMALLMYEQVRLNTDPRGALLDFLESCYLAGAKLSGWDIADLKVSPLAEM